MGDHFALLVNRLLTESTLENAIPSMNMLQQQRPASVPEHVIDIHEGSSPRTLGECRICHDEDEKTNMEVPCFCRGSLKYAHRKCVQRWCNEKGDTVCEICHQLFKPGYTAQPPLFHSGAVPINFRGNWEISGDNVRNHQFMSMVSTDRNSLDRSSDDYSVPTSRSLICCRIVAMIFIVLLVLRHTLPFIIYGAGEYSISLVMLLMLRTIGILLPVYIMVKASMALQRRRTRQDSHIFRVGTSEEENELPRQQPEEHVVRVPTSLVL